MTRQPPKEECLNCGKRKPEPDMFYVSQLDEYYCDQKCFDKHCEKEK